VRPLQHPGAAAAASLVASEGLGESEVGEAQRGAGSAGEEDVGGFEVAVHDDWVSIVQVPQRCQYVSDPAPHLSQRAYALWLIQL
jgi:hypothetical protein